MKSFRKYVNEKLRIAPKIKPKKSTFKGVEPDSKGWKKGKVSVGIGTHTSDGTTINLKKGTTLHYHAHGDKHIGSTNPKDPGTYFRMDKNRVNESTENPEYDPELGEMNIGEEYLVLHGDGNYVMTTDGDKVKFVTRDKSKAKRFSKSIATKFANQPRPNSKKPSGRVVRAEEVEIEEMSAKAHYKSVMKGGKGKGFVVSTPIDRERYPNRERQGLEGPYKSRKSGKIFYYDKKAGKYYDPGSDMFLDVSDVMEDVEQVDELKAKTMRSYISKAQKDNTKRVTRMADKPSHMKADKGEMQKLRKRQKGVVKAKTDLDMRKIAGKDYRKRMGEEVEEVTEKFEMEFADKETAQKFMSQIVRLRLGSATGTKDGKVTVHGPVGAGVGSPTRAHQQMAKIMKKHGGKIVSTDEGPRMKKVFEAPKVKIKLDPKKKIGYEIKSIGPGGKKTVTKRRDMPGKTDVGESKVPGSDPRLKKLSKESKAELAVMANSFGHSGGPRLDADNVIGLTKKAVDLCIRDADKAIKNMGPKIPAKFKKMRVTNLAKLKKELGTK